MVRVERFRVNPKPTEGRNELYEYIADGRLAIFIYYKHFLAARLQGTSRPTTYCRQVVDSSL